MFNKSEASEQISPEAQISNVIGAMIGYMDTAPFNGRVDLMRHSLRQLKEMWRLYQDNKLEPIDNEVPF